MLNFEFHSPWFLALFLLFIPLIIKDFRAKKSKGIAVPSIQNMREDRFYFLVRKFLKLSKYFVLSALILAMARSRTFTISQDRDDTKGIDIILAVDVSLSMLAKDLEPDRMEALKTIAQDFVKKRPNDRIGLVTYSGEAITKVPITFDHQVLHDELANLDPTELQMGTAIGEGLAVAVAHLKDSKAKSKVVILMTDGVNTIENAMPPMIAAELAKSNDIKVYTIGIGTNGFAMMPTNIDDFGNLIFSPAEVKIDEPILQDIAQMTGGRYFRATSNERLEQVYQDINVLEKSELKTQKLYNYEEHFRKFLWIAIIILLIDAVMRWFWFKVLN